MGEIYMSKTKGRGSNYVVLRKILLLFLITETLDVSKNKKNYVPCYKN